MPQVLYSAETLPAPVVAMREKLNNAAKEGNIEAFRAIFDAQQVKPILSYDRVEDPIAFLKDTSGDGEGLELLAIMQDILETGYVHINEGKEDEAYVWPYFAQYPLDSLDNKQLVEMYRVVTSIDYFEMRDYGAWTFYKVAISPKGDLLYFVAGD
ncbi:hypothetical protein E1162_15825 [Rhodobacteraceae bacterium RKSG542]|nr:hypothetical protein [Pseudovibrio flavus]